VGTVGQDQTKFIGREDWRGTEEPRRMKSIERREGKKAGRIYKKTCSESNRVLQNDSAGRVVFQECTDLPTEGGRSCQDGKGMAESEKIPMEVGCICTEKYQVYPIMGWRTEKRSEKSHG
jgi:hypothetical protein